MFRWGQVGYLFFSSVGGTTLRSTYPDGPDGKDMGGGDFDADRITLNLL